MQKEVITKVTTNYKFLLDGNKTTSKVTIGENVFFIYTPFKFDGHSFKINNDGLIQFGCQRPALNEIKSVLKFIKDGICTTETWMVNIRGGKLFKKSDILEESENYYIVGNGNFRKDNVNGEMDFPIDIPNLTRRDIWSYGKNIWCYYSHPLAKTDEEVIKKLTYIVETLENFEKAKTLANAL